MIIETMVYDVSEVVLYMLVFVVAYAIIVSAGLVYTWKLRRD
jgi:hypothetical protein